MRMETRMILRPNHFWLNPITNCVLLQQERCSKQACCWRVILNLGEDVDVCPSPVLPASRLWYCNGCRGSETVGWYYVGHHTTSLSLSSFCWLFKQSHSKLNFNQATLVAWSQTKSATFIHPFNFIHSISFIHDIFMWWISSTSNSNRFLMWRCEAVLVRRILC